MLHEAVQITEDALYYKADTHQPKGPDSTQLPKKQSTIQVRVSKSASTLQQIIQLAEIQVEDEKQEVEHYVDEREGVYGKEN